MDVNVRQLRSFITVAKLKSFTQAAAVLHVSQPTLTVQIKGLEDALRLRLFDRTPRSVELTRMGRELLPVLERILQDLDSVLLLADGLRELERFSVTTVLSGLAKTSLTWEAISQWTDGMTRVRNFVVLDEAIEWAEDQIVYRYGGHVEHGGPVPLAEQALLAGLSLDDIAALAGLGGERTFSAGESVIRAGESGVSLFLITSGQVSVRLPSGIRLAALTGGMVVGEMALLGDKRAADVIADTDVASVEVPVDRFREFADRHPQIGKQIMQNLAALLAQRLRTANVKVDLLSAD